MKNIVVLILLFINFSSVFAGSPAGGLGGPPKYNPIDTNQVILVVAAVLLMVGVIAYKKLNIKKA